MRTLSCIGAGLLGKTLCQLLSSQVRIGQVINRSPLSSQNAVDFIGTGTPACFADIAPAAIWLIATTDDAIESTGQALYNSGVLKPGNIVFHCSGSVSSAAVFKFASDDIYTGSVHPIHSFANPSESLKCFAGTHCAVEGQPQATALLTHLFTALGALPFAIDADRKALYHASTVMACNYLVSLLETSQQMLLASGYPAKGSSPLEPLIRQTMDNFFKHDAKSALTGPIARGDDHVVASHLEAMAGEPNGDLWQQVYSALGSAAVPISAQQGQASTESLQAITKLLLPKK